MSSYTDGASAMTAFLPQMRAQLALPLANNDIRGPSVFTGNGFVPRADILVSFLRANHPASDWYRGACSVLQSTAYPAKGPDELWKILQPGSVPSSFAAPTGANITYQSTDEFLRALQPTL